jgi:hypothetical protein
VLDENNEDSNIQGGTEEKTESSAAKVKEGEEDFGDSRRSRLKFVVTLDQPRDLWYMRFGSELGLTKA